MFEVTKILEQNIKGGTGTRAAIGCPAAGKTGTTENNANAWFVGYTPKLATAVWVGFPKANIPMGSLFNGGPVDGGTFPAQIWGDYMNRVKGRYCGDFASPKEPFVSSPFYGRYANSGGKYIEGGDRGSTDTSAGSTTTVPSAPEDTGGTEPATGEAAPEQDNGGFDPGSYESPPQPEPETAPPPADPGVGEGGGATAPP